MKNILAYKKNKSWVCCLLMLIKTAYYSILLKKKVWVGCNGVIRSPSNFEVGGGLDVGTIFNSFSSCREKILIDCQGPVTIHRYASFGDGSQVIVRNTGSLSIGHATIGPRLKLFSDVGVVIGDRVSISWDVTILDTSFHEIVGGRGKAMKVTIEDDVWIGANVIILPGAHIKRGSVVGAGAVVGKVDDEEKVLIVGNPAKIVKRNVVWEL